MPYTPTEQRQVIAASFLPPALRTALATSPDDARLRRLGEFAAIMWCDIADFTRLANRLVNAGVEQLHALLNEHYKILLDCVARHGGEPQVFVGDAVLVAWPCREAEAAFSVARAVACGRDAAALPLPPDDHGQPLRIHVYVSYGRLELLDFGGPAMRHYLPIGDALEDLHSITHLRAAGGVIVSARAARLAILNDDDAIEAAITVPAQATSPLIDAIRTAPVPETSLDPWLPAPVASRLDQSQLAWVAELRPITVVFALLRDFDHMTATAAGRFADLADAVREPLARHEAVLNQIVIDEKGPTLLAYLGIPPFAHADDPTRGVRLGLDLSAELRRLGIRVQVGVTTAQAYCGVVGNDVRRHYTVLANHVNLGARLMLLANADTGPLCDDATRQAARTEIDFEPCGRVRVKGYDTPVFTWRPKQGTDTARTASMLGRKSELAAIDEIFAQLDDRGGAVAIVGQAGIGKTQLLGSLRARLLRRRFRVLDGAASVVGRDSPYFAWRPIFERLFDIDLQADIPKRRTAVLARLDPDLVDQAGLLNVVLPYDFTESTTLYAFSGTQRSAATQTLLKTLLARAAARDRLLITLEDTHLCDTASWELLQSIAEEPAGIFLALTTRPEPERLDTLIGAHRMYLSNLDEKSAGALLAEFLGVRHVSDDIQRWVIQRSGGHPFVITELARMLQDSRTVTIANGVLVPTDPAKLAALELPQTIQGFITYRLDRLEPGPQLTVKIAAVIGSEFPDDTVADIHPVDTERAAIPAHLVLLDQRGLVHPLSRGEIDSHAFQHELVREVAYGLLPHARRRELHHATAQWYERRFGTNSPLYFGTLAHHFEHAGEIDRAVDYLEQEAIRAFSAGLARQSVELGRRAAALLGLELPVEPAVIQGRIGENFGTITEALAGRVPQQLLDLPTLDDSRIERLIALLLRTGPFAFQAHEMGLFALMAVTALRLTLQHGNSALSADVYSMYSVVHRALTGDRIGAYKWSELALEMDQRNGRTLRGRVGFVHTWFHHHWAHPLRDSGPIALDAAEAAFAAGDILFGCFNISSYVIYLFASGEPLSHVMQCARDYLQRNGRRVMNAAFHLIHEMQVAKALAGLTEAPLSLTDSEYDERRDIASICDTDLGNQIGYYLVSRVKLHTHFADWTGAIEWAEKAKHVLPAFEGQVAEIELIYFQAIALMQYAAELEPSAQGPILERAANLVNTMRTWAGLTDGASRSPDFDHRAVLLEAELAATRGKLNGESYQTAAVLAQENGYLPDIGLAHELHARHLLRRGDLDAATTIIARAIAAYEKWGAGAKIRMLRKLAITPSPSLPQPR